MRYIDWYYEKVKKERKIFENRKDGYKGWKDLVTGTYYCISDEDYNRIYEEGKQMLGQFLKEGSLKKMEQLFYGHERTKDADLFPDLPYFMNLETDIEECARIRDYVCFRTACLYALKYPYLQNASIQNVSIQNNSVQKASTHNVSSEEESRNQIRMQGFSWHFADNAGECEELERIEQMLLMAGGTKTKNGSIIDLTELVDLVKGGLVKIKQYYLETNKIPEIRGASLLLERVNTEKMEQLISREHIRECLIYAGGGKMMGIFPNGTGEDMRRKIEVMAEKETVTALFNFCSRPYQLTRLVTDYKNVVDEMDLALEERQGLRWDFRLEPQADRFLLSDLLKHEGGKEIKDSENEFCTSCRNRHAAAVLTHGGEEEKLCPSCLRKRSEGGRSAKRSRHQKYKEFVQRTYKKVISDDVKSYNKLSDLSENGFIGIIYGDANSMSSGINRLNSFMTMRYFSEVTADAVTSIVYRALYKNLGNSLSFEIIAVGGDDIFLFVPGNKAYDIACTIGQEFDDQFQNKSNQEYQMTMSLGVCITHDNMPVQYSFAAAQELLKSAKQKAWQEGKKGNAGGTIDWMVIENEMPGGADLTYLRKSVTDKPEKTLRPYTWDQARAVKKFIKKLEDEKSFAFQLRQSWYRRTKEEAELFYEYQVSRKEDTKVRCALKRLAREFGGEAASHNIMCQGTAYSPWLDAVELWDYTEVCDEKGGNRNSASYKVL